MSASEIMQGDVIATDGKTLRRSHDRYIDKDAIHMVSAWATASGVALGQAKVDGRSNEITAIPELLKMLSVKGCIVTVDAMGPRDPERWRIPEFSRIWSRFLCPNVDPPSIGQIYSRI